MNNNFGNPTDQITDYQLDHFQELVAKLYQCCQERMQYQSDRFNLPDAELRCLLLFGEERYLTSKGIAHKMNVVKSRVTRIIEGMLQKGLIQRIKDPEDSRVNLLSLTSAGSKKLDDINHFLRDVHSEVLTQITPEQRRHMMASLEMLKSAMQSVKDMMV
ncbi:hypothetical protein D3OALGA1CA_2454 [Olavius algarvensis associated proteobacterium Delta 3]|nr:hypothetical protein D3OALGA1CA_2454 [Olavius algarvensis associated proteobacterium Delta 3]CAB5155135.1 hypothetical protein D3OALGB2SA_5055 [Olavius algarvensis associated proteobacterium Delta 3]